MLFDTADVYGDNYHNEIMIGKALKQLPREKIQLATKFGLTASEGLKFGVNGTPEYVRNCCEPSLKRLDVDYIDMYYQHRVDTSVPKEDTMGELKKMVEEGKIKHIGLSEASVDMISRAHVVHPLTAAQMEYSLWSCEIEDDIIPPYRELGIGIVAYGSLGHDFFGGKATMESLPTHSIYIEPMHRFTGDNLEKNKSIYDRFANLAAERSCTPQLALAWILHQAEDIIPIPGTTKVKNLGNNIGSLLLKLTQDDLREISDTMPISEVGGERECTILSDLGYKFANTLRK